jgi:S-methylmethionine-dependent homocysteine/selenocysteine methylase
VQASAYRSPTILDGALGAMLEAQLGPLPAPLWSAAALQSNPAAVEALHRAYCAAGAQVLVANTFRTNPRAIRLAGLSPRDGAELTALAVTCARRAADGRTDVRIAASVAPVADCYAPEQVPDEAVLLREHGEFAEWLSAAGVELAWIETINTIREAACAARAARAAGLAFGVSFVTRAADLPSSARSLASAAIGRGGVRLLSGEPLAEAVCIVQGLGARHVGLNCIPPRGITQQLPRLRRMTELPVAVYAHLSAGLPTPGWSFVEQLPPERYAGYARLWRQQGADIIGGCCGTTPEHIRATAEALSAETARRVNAP